MNRSCSNNVKWTKKHETVNVNDSSAPITDIKSSNDSNDSSATGENSEN